MKPQWMLPMTAPVVVISVLLLVVGIFAAWHVHSVDQSNSELLDHSVTSAKAAQEFEIGIREMRTLLNNYLLTGERRYFDGIPVYRPETSRALDEAEALALNETELYLMAQVRQGYRRFFEEFERIQKKNTSLDSEEVRKLTDHLNKEILMPAHQYLALNLQMAEQTNRENKRLSTWAVAILVGLGICGAIVGMLAGLTLAQRFRRSIVKLNLTVRDAAGKLSEVTEPVTVSGGEDFTNLEETLPKISESIHAVVAQLHQSQREILRAEQLAALGQLAAGLAHEFRNPLTAIKILVQSATCHGEAGILAGRDLAILEKEISRLEQSIQNFLDFARPPRLDRKRFEIRHVLEQTMDLLAARASNQGVHLERRFADEPALVDADMGQMRQVVLNLLLNALDVLPQGGEISAEVTASSVNGGGVSINISDTGPGIPSAIAERIFEPFVSTKETGLGLGLSICKRIVEAHGGTVSARDRPGGGTIFTVQLPSPGAAEFAARQAQIVEVGV